jgi:hypothetical protein
MATKDDLLKHFEWAKNPNYIGIPTKENNINSSTTGLPITVGRLSIEELSEAAIRMGAPVQVVFNQQSAETFVRTNKQPVVLFFNNHYNLFLHLPFSVDPFFFFDPFPRFVNSFYCCGIDNPSPYQGTGSDLCGVYCLFVLYLAKKNNIHISSGAFLQSLIQQYLTPDTLMNDFVMQYWALNSQIGEEFYSKKAGYQPLQNMRKFLKLYPVPKP